MDRQQVKRLFGGDRIPVCIWGDLGPFASMLAFLRPKSRMLSIGVIWQLVKKDFPWPSISLPIVDTIQITLA